MHQMQITNGAFDGIGNPTVSIQVAGVYSSPPETFNAIIDTGFTGFLSMPIIRAFPLGLPLRGSTDVTLADGKTQSRLMADALVTVGGQSHTGLVILEPAATDVLLGMDFLRTFSLALLVSAIGVALVDEGTVKQAFDALAAAAAKT
jgi:predicted aspartyl protease